MAEESDLKVLIADDEPLAAERLQLMLARCPRIDLVGTASDGESAVRMADALREQGQLPFRADVERRVQGDPDHAGPDEWMRRRPCGS